MRNPFLILNAAAEAIAEIKGRCVDREDELHSCRSALVERHHNVLLYGSRGVGKTFLLRMIDDSIRQCAPNVFTCRVNIASLMAYGNTDEVAAFPRAVLLQLCAAIWETMLGKGYLELRNRLEETDQELSVLNEEERTVQRIYRHLMRADLSSRVTLFNSTGLSGGVTSEKGQEVQKEIRVSDILPFEFAAFADELVTRVLRPYGRDRLVILCDEANQMPLFRQEQILDRYLELFSSHHTQFLFVAGMVSWDDRQYLPSCFETVVELKGFPRKEDVVELIQKANISPMEFTQDAIAALYGAYQGHPRYTIEACYFAFEEADRSGTASVSATIVEAVCRDLERRRQEQERMMRHQMGTGRPIG